MPETIPELFDAAVAAVPDKEWLVAGDESFTYAEARERIGRAAAALAALGIGRGDLVLATMRSTPDYLFTWLASAYTGSILVTQNPRSAEAEHAGLVGQVRPRLVVTDPGLDAVVAGARGWGAGAVVDVARLFDEGPGGDGTGPARPEDPAVLIPTSGTTGRSKLVTQTHRAYVMAGEGFPWWMELTPDDRLMTSLPLFHINAPTYSMLGSVGARASLALLPSFSASTFIDLGPPPRGDRVQRDRRDARDPDAAAGAARRRRQPAAPVLHRPGADASSVSSRSSSASACASCAATRCPRRRTARSGRAARGRTARSGASASIPRSASSTRAA